MIPARLRALREPRGFAPALFLASCVPAALAVFGLASDILRHTRYFGSNPIKEGEHFLGEWILRFLIATLAVTPLRQWLGWHWLARHRRTLGLFAFAYGVLHWLTYVLLDLQLQWGDLKADLAKRPFIMVGMAGLLSMLPLALTSTAASIRRLGGRRWRRLHRLVYAASLLGVIHYWMSVKADVKEPLMYGAGFAVLFLFRIVKWLRGSRAGSASLATGEV